MNNYKHYAIVVNGKLNGKGQCPCSGDGIICLEIPIEVYDNIEKYIYQDGEIVLNPNYEQEQIEKEQKRVANLTMTALDFITFLRTCGLSLETIRAYLDQNIELDTQLKYCQSVYCGVAYSVMPITLGDITITKEMVINAFKTKNGEVIE